MNWATKTLHLFAPAPARLSNYYCNAQVKKFDKLCCSCWSKMNSMVLIVSQARQPPQGPIIWHNIETIKYLNQVGPLGMQLTRLVKHSRFCNFAIWHTFSRFSLIFCEFLTQQLRVGPAHSSLRVFRTLPLHSSYPRGCDVMRKAQRKKGKEKRRGAGGLRNNVLLCPTMSPEAQRRAPERWHLRDEIMLEWQQHETLKHQAAQQGRSSAERGDEVAGSGHKPSLFQESLRSQQLRHSGIHSFRGGKKKYKY